MNHLVLTREELDVNEISNIVSAESCGAISIFVGTTRDSFEGKKVISLEYEAYEPMAVKQIQLICEELRRQWPDIVNVAICHRLGLVGTKKASVVIAISSPHRKTSLDAVATAIEDLKKRVPIWKKEIYKNDEFTWKENKESNVGCSDKLKLFNDCMCDIEDSHPLPIQLVQISASEDEMKRRIQCFVEKKRDEIDLCNIMDFTDVKIQAQTNEHKANTTREEESNNELMSCARVNSIVVKQEYSKCHLKVRRVENNIGPQTRPDYLNTLDKLMEPTDKNNLHSQFFVNEKEIKQTRNNFEETVLQKYPAIVERLENIEDHVNLPQSKVKNIYQRLKVIEDRILYLESISPEYRHFLVENSNFLRDPSNGHESVNEGKNTGLLVNERKIYSVGEIDTIIKSFEERDFNYQNSNIIE